MTAWALLCAVPAVFCAALIGFHRVMSRRLPPDPSYPQEDR